MQRDTARRGTVGLGGRYETTARECVEAAETLRRFLLAQHPETGSAS
jgi:hypothetical protein